MPGIFVAEFHKSPSSQPAGTPSGMVKTTITETLFWVSARRPTSSWRLASVQGHWGWAKSTRVGFSETSWIAELRGKSVTGGAAFTGVNSSCAKIRDPTTINETQSTPAAARKPRDHLLLLTALIRLLLPIFLIQMVPAFTKRVSSLGINSPTKRRLKLLEQQRMPSKLSITGEIITIMEIMQRCCCDLPSRRDHLRRFQSPITPDEIEQRNQVSRKDRCLGEIVRLQGTIPGPLNAWGSA